MASIVPVAPKQQSTRPRGQPKKEPQIPKRVITVFDTLTISDTEGASKKSRAAAGCSSSSIHTARRKSARGTTTNSSTKPKDPDALVVNNDALDVNKELAVAEYVEDIYSFYKLTEDKSRVGDYMASQPDINLKMRSRLIDWLMDVHTMFKLRPETFYLTINIVDRYLSVKTIPSRELQLLGICSMLIASKYEEVYAPEANDLIAKSESDNGYSREQVFLMERAILRKLNWYFAVPTPYVFLVQYVKVAAALSGPSDDHWEMENMVFFLAELGLMHYPTIIMYCPSMIAASAVYAARCTLNKNPFWNETLTYHTGYHEHQLRDFAKLLISYHSDCGESELKAAYRKFSSPDRASVALIPPARNTVLGF